MLIKQISVFIENKAGKLCDAIKVLGDNNIDIFALSIADTTDFGVLRLIVSDPDTAKEKLKENGYIVKRNHVLAVIIDDKPGGLAHTLAILKDNNIAIEYMYAFIGKSDKGATVVMRVDDWENAVKLLENTDVELVDAKDLYR